MDTYKTTIINTVTRIMRIIEQHAVFAFILLFSALAAYLVVQSGAIIDKEPSAWKAAKDTEGRILNDKYFVNSSVQYNDVFQPMIQLTFNNEGAEIFGELTKRLIGKPIAIFV